MWPEPRTKQLLLRRIGLFISYKNMAPQNEEPYSKIEKIPYFWLVRFGFYFFALC